LVSDIGERRSLGGMWRVRSISLGGGLLSRGSSEFLVGGASSKGVLNLLKGANGKKGVALAKGARGAVCWQQERVKRTQKWGKGKR